MDERGQGDHRNSAARPTLADVARSAKLGVATVSRALSGHPDVRAETREHVHAVARQLGYRPSGTARALRRGSFLAVTAIIPDQVWGWWEPVLRAASEATAAAGYHLFIRPLGDGEGGLPAVIDTMASVPTEGVVVVSVPDQAAVQEACARIGMPVVAIDDTAQVIHIPTVSVRNREGAATMTSHLIAQGHARIAFVGAKTGTFTNGWGEGLFVEERLAGFRQALEESGLRLRPGDVLGWPAPGDEAPAVVEGLSALIEREGPPDAIFCAADLLAAPTLRTLREHGLRVPEDVAVAGFDDERAALLLDPQLTTMRQPYEELGRTAIDLLLRIIDGAQVPAERTLLETSLVVRASTAPSSRRPQTFPVG